MATVPTPNRGEIWLVNFDPATGAEMKKLRPAIVVSLNSIGKLPLRVIVPITDWKPEYVDYPWFVQISADKNTGLRKDSGADAFQVKSVSVNRFRRKIGSAGDFQIDAIAAAVALCVGAA